jgi:hypothetical protein
MLTTARVLTLTAASIAGVAGLSVGPPTSTALQNAKICGRCVGSGLPPKNLMKDMSSARRTETKPPPGTGTCKWVPASNKTGPVCSYDDEKVWYPNELGPEQLDIAPSDKTEVGISLKINEGYLDWIEVCALNLVLLYGADVTSKIITGGRRSSKWTTEGAIIRADPAKGTVTVTKHQVPGIVRRENWGEECSKNTFMPDLDRSVVTENITQIVLDPNKQIVMFLNFDANSQELSVRMNGDISVLPGFKNFKMLQIYGVLNQCWRSNISVTQANCDTENSGNETNVDPPSQSCEEMISPVSLFSGCLVRPSADYKESGKVVVTYNENGWGNFSGDLSRDDNYARKAASLFSENPDDKQDFNIETRIKFDPVINDIFRTLGCGMDLVLMPRAWFFTDGSALTTKPLFIVSVDSSTGTATIIFQKLPLLSIFKHCPYDQRPMIIQQPERNNSALCSMSVRRGDELRVSHQRRGGIYQVGLSTNNSECSMRFYDMKWSERFSFKLMPHPDSKGLEAINLCYSYFKVANITRPPGCEEKLTDPNYTVGLTPSDDPIYTTGPEQKTPENHEDDETDVIKFFKENGVIIGSCVGVLFILTLFIFYLLNRYVSQAERGQEMEEFGPRDPNPVPQTDQPGRNNVPDGVTVTVGDALTEQHAQPGRNNGPAGGPIIMSILPPPGDQNIRTQSSTATVSSGLGYANVDGEVTEPRND